MNRLDRVYWERYFGRQISPSIALWMVPRESTVQDFCLDWIVGKVRTDDPTTRRSIAGRLAGIIRRHATPL